MLLTALSITHTQAGLHPKHDPDLFRQILSEVTEQITGEKGSKFLLYPEEHAYMAAEKQAHSSPPRRRLLGLMDHQQLIRRKYQAAGVHVVAQRQHYEGLTRQPRHPRYGTESQRRTEATQAYDTEGEGLVLTVNNTRPIRVIANYDAFYEDNVEPYTLCFREGDWFKVSKQF